MPDPTGPPPATTDQHDASLTPASSTANSTPGDAHDYADICAHPAIPDALDTVLRDEWGVRSWGCRNPEVTDAVGPDTATRERAGFTLVFAFGVVDDANAFYAWLRDHATWCAGVQGVGFQSGTETDGTDGTDGTEDDTAGADETGSVSHGFRRPPTVTCRVRGRPLRDRRAPMPMVRGAVTLAELVVADADAPATLDITLDTGDARDHLEELRAELDAVAELDEDESIAEQAGDATDAPTTLSVPDGGAGTVTLPSGHHDDTIDALAYHVATLQDVTGVSLNSTTGGSLANATLAVTDIEEALADADVDEDEIIAELEGDEDDSDVRGIPECPECEAQDAVCLSTDDWICQECTNVYRVED